MTALSAFTYPFRGLRLITRYAFWRYSAIPLLINIALFAGMGSLLFGQLDGWTDALLPPGGWHDYVRWLVWPLAILGFLLIGFFCFTLVGSVVAAPFTDLLAARIMATSGVDGSLTDVRRLTWHGSLSSIADELGKLWFVVSRSLPALLLFLAPGVNILAPVIWFLVGSWLLAFEYLEHPLAETGSSFAEQRQLLRGDPLVAISFGAGVSVLMLIPVLNLAAIPASVAGACLLWQERWQTAAA